MNFRDLGVASGRYFGGAVGRDTAPLSDGAGEVAADGRAEGDGLTLPLDPLDKAAAVNAPPFSRLHREIWWSR